MYREKMYIEVKDLSGTRHNLPLHKVLEMTNEGMVIFDTPRGNSRIVLDKESREVVNDYILNLVEEGSW